jgi:N-acyl-D-amino-acid deacylase
MTALPAEIFRIGDVGLVATEKTADLVAFDGATIADDLDYRDPVRVPKGIAWVMQAGEMVVRNGKLCGDRRGKRLRLLATL